MKSIEHAEQEMQNEGGLQQEFQSKCRAKTPIAERSEAFAIKTRHDLKQKCIQHPLCAVMIGFGLGAALGMLVNVRS